MLWLDSVFVVVCHMFLIHALTSCIVATWRFKVFAESGVVVSVVGLINEVNQRWARLVLGWVTVYGQVNHLGM